MLLGMPGRSDDDPPITFSTIPKAHGGFRIITRLAPPDDVGALKNALAELHERFANGGLPGTEIPEATRHRLSRRARAEELAELVRSL